MALRLTGRPLRVVRHLTSSRAVARLVWAVAAPDFGIPQLDRLPPSARGAVPDSATPLAGRTPHHWHDDALASAPRRPSARDLHAAFREGRTTPSALLEAWLARLAAPTWGEATFSPFVSLDPEVARAEAAAATARYAAGTPRGVLDGVPVPVKDQVDVAGLPTWGGTITEATPASTDAWVVQRLRAAGALVVAKTHATEWGLNPFGACPHHSLPRNVWSHDHGGGGSSTGSGVAVALGWCPVALGSDGGGSIRIPASLNGVFGLKPTWNRIGHTGNQWSGGSVGHLGPIGGTVQDLVDFLAVTAAADPHDPTTQVAPDGHDARAWQAALGRGVRGCRIGIDPVLWDGAEPAVARTARVALDALVAAGATLVEVRLAHAEVAPAAGALLIAGETAASLSDHVAAHEAAYGDELRIILRIMAHLPAQRWLACTRIRSALRDEVARAFRDEIDLLALPTTAAPAPRYGLHEDRQDVLSPKDTAAMTRFAFLANLLGLPAGTVPSGRVGGLPVGLQLVGDAWDEASVIAGMAEAERQGVTDLGRPPGWVDLTELAGSP